MFFISHITQLFLFSPLSHISEEEGERERNEKEGSERKCSDFIPRGAQ